MARLSVYKLHFTTPLHIGDNKLDYGVSLKTLQSDSIYAAITSCLAKMGEIIPESGDLGFSISSLFPFYQIYKDSKAVYFLPKPIKQSLPKHEDISDRKSIKNVSWIDLDYFKKYYCSNNKENIFDNKEDIANIKGEYFTNKDIREDFITSQISPRVVISRSNEEDARPFYIDRLYFQDYSGLYFIVLGDTNLLNKGLNLLQHEGIGSYRSTGNGFFEFNKDVIEIDILEDSDTIFSLSMYIPENKEELVNMISNNDKIGYDFIRRGGWVTTRPYNTIRKNFIYSFIPGSVFYSPNASLCTKGKIVELTPEVEEFNHRIWRNGKSIFIPIKI